MKKSLLKRTLLIGGSSLGLLALSGFWLVTTETGTSLLVKGLTGVLPMISVERVSGPLSALKLSHFRLQTESFSLHAQEADLNLALKALLSGEIRLTDLRMTGLDMVLLPSAENENNASADTATDSRLALPLDLVIEKADIARLSLTTSDMILSLSRLKGSYDWRDDSMRLQTPALEDLSIRLRSNADTPDDGNSTSLGIREMLARLQTEALFKLPVFGNEGPLSFNLTLDDLTLERFTFVEADAKDLPAAVVSNIRLSTALRRTELTIDELSAKTAFSELPSLSLNGRLSLKDNWATDLNVSLRTAISSLPLGETQGHLRGNLAEQVSLRVDTCGELKTKLSLDWAPTQPGIPGRLDLSLLTPRRLMDGATSEESLVLGTGSLRLEGRADAWTLHGFTTLQRGSLPPALLTVSGAGHPEGASLSDLRLKSRSGSARFEGDISWKDILRWHGRAGVESLDLTDFLTVPATDLNGSATLTGHWSGGNDWQSEMPTFTLSGQYRQKPMTLDGALILKDNYRLYAPKVSLTLGDNKADFLAKFDKPVFEADLKIDAPALSDFDPLLEGNVKGSILLRGNPAAPVFVANLKGASLGYGDTKIDTATLAGTIKPDRHGTVGGKMALVAKHLTDARLAGMDTRVIALVLDGTDKSHTLKLGIQGQPFAAGLRLEGALNRQTLDWSGRLASAKLTTPTGLWTLEKSAALNWKQAPQTLLLAPHAWRHPDARLRFDQTLKLGESGRISLLLEHLGLSLFDGYLPQEARLTGSVKGRADVEWFADGQRSPIVNLGLQSRDFTLHREMQRSDGGDLARLSLPMKDLTVSARLTREKAALDWHALLRHDTETSATGRFSGRLRITDPTGLKNLSGETTVDALDMRFLNTFFMTGERAEGMASGHLSFGGSLLAPELVGSLQIRDLCISEGMTPVEMQPSDVSMRFTGTQSLLTALIKTDNGELSLEGLADWADLSDPTAQIRAFGRDLSLTLPPYAKIRLTPDVFAKAEKERIVLGGLIDIPFAKIHVTELPPSTVGVSRDEVMLNDDLEPIKPKSAQLPIVSQLRIRLGEKVKLDAFGLKTKLTGAVDVMQTKRGLGLTGQLNLKRGRFKAYGQDLQLENGSIIFAGPVDRPTLDITAVRNPEKTEDGVTAGIKVTGTADAPKLAVFARPAMPREEALAYLLRGHGVENTDEENNNAVLTSALIGIGISQTGNLFGTIGDAVGIRDFGVDTAGTGESSQVVVSGYVLPRLQVKYGAGLFDSLSTLTLRYRLMPKLFLESVSGVNQSVDLLYKFEF